MKRIVLTGATSMLGVALIQECIKNKTEVFALLRPDSKKISRLPISNLIHIIPSELKHLENLKVENRGYDAFYHFGWTGTDKESRNDPDEQMMNIKYTLDAVRLAKRMGCCAFIGAGSQAEYGRVSDIISPSTAVNPDNSYGIAKYAAGQLSSILCKELGMKHIWTRIFSIYGLYDNEATMVMYSINQLIKEEKPFFTKSEQVWDYLYSEDAARAFYLIGVSGRDQSLYCIGSGKARPLIEYIKIIRDCIDERLQLGIGDIAYSPNQVMHLCADISNLVEDTGFYPEIDFREGIKRTISWVKEGI